MICKRFAGCRVDFLDNLSDLARNLSSVNVEKRSVANSHNSRMVQDNHVSSEFNSNSWWVVNRTNNVSTRDILLLNTSQVETNVITRLCLGQLLVVHFNGLDFTNNTLAASSRHNNDFLTNFHNASLDLSDRNNTDTSDVVNILNRQSQC